MILSLPHIGYDEEEDNSVTEADVFEITGVVPPNLVAQLLNACASDSYDKLDGVVQDIIREGFRYWKRPFRKHGY